MNTGPEGAITPLELLENRDIFAPSIISQWYNPVCGATIALIGSIFGNAATRKPILSGIQRHILFCAGGFLIGKYFDGVEARKHADRDAMYRHYIQLHPEDFPPIERKQLKDILENWYPTR